MYWSVSRIKFIIDLQCCDGHQVSIQCVAVRYFHCLYNYRLASMNVFPCQYENSYS